MDADEGRSARGRPGRQLRREERQIKIFIPQKGSSSAFIVERLPECVKGLPFRPGGQAPIPLGTRLERIRFKGGGRTSPSLSLLLEGEDDPGLRLWNRAERRLQEER